MAGIGHHVDISTQQHLNGVMRIGSREGRLESFFARRDIPLHTPAEERLLAAEGKIEAGGSNLERSRQIDQRRAVVAPPKKVCGGTHRLFHVETARSSHGPIRFILERAVKKPLTLALNVASTLVLCKPLLTRLTGGLIKEVWVVDGAFAVKKFIEIKGRKMAYIDEGEGAPIVFQHGNPTSSYLWRKVMPACAGLGRLIACDLIGMGDSDKLPNSGPDRYTYVEQRDFLFALWERLGLDRDVVLVIHDWGATLGFDWACRHPSRVQGIAYMEAAPLPLTWSDFPGDEARQTFEAFRSPAGEDMVLRDNLFVEAFLLDLEKDNLTDADRAEYRRPFAEAGEGRRPTLTWPRQIPIDGSPANVDGAVRAFSAWLADSETPKLWIKGNPGFIANGRFAEFCAKLKNQAAVQVKGGHFLQESSGPAVGAAVADFVRRLRG